MSKVNKYITCWDHYHCEKHVVNLVTCISHKILDYYNNTPIFLIDIGANVGKVYDLLSNLVSIEQAYMFEPNYNLYKYLKEKYKQNTNIDVSNKAISINNGISYFDSSSMDYQIKHNYEDLNFGLSKITHEQTSTLVETIKISDFLNLNKLIYQQPCFIKIDTENYDYQILSDLISVIDLFLKKPIIEFENNYFVDGYDDIWAQNIIDKYVLKGYQKLIVDRNMGDGILYPVL